MGIRLTENINTLIRCAPMSECAAWGKCARSLPAAGGHGLGLQFQHFGPRPDGQRCGAFVPTILSGTTTGRFTSTESNREEK